MELTILMPCLNEAETLEICIEKAKGFLKYNNIDGEILISDNGSTDGSIEIAQNCGARVINAEQKGYGNALIAGCNNAYGKYVIMGDADDSYDFTNLMPFLDKLRAGYDLVMGNRFKGGIEKGAMPWLHRYIGNPVLSFIGRLFYKSEIRDFHCGLRGYNRKSILELNLCSGGMEYASEMVVKAELYGLKIVEIPTTLKKDGRNRPPHLRSFPDGWRHLKFLFYYAPKWLYLFPGIILFMAGILLGLLALTDGYGKAEIALLTMMVLSAFCLISGFGCVDFYFIHSLCLYKRANARITTINWNKICNEDKFIFAGLILSAIGLGFIIYLIFSTQGDFNIQNAIQILLAAGCFVIGIQQVLTGFEFSSIKRSSQ